MTKLTALIIATRGDDIHCGYGGPDENGMFTGWITLGPEDRYRALINSEPVYRTGPEAEEAMKRVVREIREDPPFIY